MVKGGEEAGAERRRKQKEERLERVETTERKKREMTRDEGRKEAHSGAVGSLIDHKKHNSVLTCWFFLVSPFYKLCGNVCCYPRNCHPFFLIYLNT